MCTYPSQYCSYAYPAWGSQSMPFESYPLPSLSTGALQDIVEGQQRTTNGVVSLLSQERASNERDTRDHKQQLASLAALAQNFLSFMPDVERKFSALENSIRSNCPSADNAEVQDRVKDMTEVVSNLRRIADGFACSTDHRLVPGFTPGLWAWVPANSPLPQQDHTPFSTTFPQAPRIFPAVIPNSTRSSVFAHSTGPARSVHWSSNLDAPASSWATPWADASYPGPYGTNSAGAPGAFSRISLGGVRGLSTGTGFGTPYTPYQVPLSPYMTHTPSDSSSIPVTGRFGPRSPPPAPEPQMPFGRHSPLEVPITESQHIQHGASSPRSASTTSQPESVVGSMRRTRLSPITESRTPSPAVSPLPAFGSIPPNGPSPSTSTIETFSTPSGPIMGSSGAPRSSLVPTPRVQSDLVVPNDPIWIDPRYLSEPFSNASSFDGFSIPSPPRVEVPPLHPVESIRWSSLFPSAPVVVERHLPPGGSGLTRVSSLDESNASAMSSPPRSIISYVGSPESTSPSEPMTPLSRISAQSTPGPVPNRLTTHTDTVNKPNESDALARSAPIASTAGSTTVVSTSNVPSISTLTGNHLAIHLASSFFESVQRVFKVPASVDLSYNGFEVSFSTISVPWSDSPIARGLPAKGGEHDRTFEIMPAPSNSALHQYIRDLARLRVDLAAMQSRGENKITDQAFIQLELRVRAEQEATQNWVRRVCEAAGAVSIGDPAFSPRK